MQFPLGVYFPGLIVICIHGIFALEMVTYNDETPTEEDTDTDKRVFDVITPPGLNNGFVKRRLDSIAHNRGFSGFTDKRLYDFEDLGLSSTMSKRPFDSIGYGPLSGFVKRRLANDRLNWYFKRPINLVGGMGPNMFMRQPVDAIYVGRRPGILPRGAIKAEYINPWYNLIGDIRLNGFAKRADEVVDDELQEYHP